MLSQISLDKNKKLAPRDSLGVFINIFSSLGSIRLFLGCINPLHTLWSVLKGAIHPHWVPSLPPASPQWPYSSSLVPFFHPCLFFLIRSFHSLLPLLNGTILPHQFLSFSPLPKALILNTPAAIRLFKKAIKKPACFIPRPGILSYCAFAYLSSIFFSIFSSSRRSFKSSSLLCFIISSIDNFFFFISAHLLS
ncbi:hypothetical protein KIS4809_4429 [Bacillus sp. ZZV12-4809]|nr:hypothetical protein KIS4809_4429 [Bacillus sp. ZZV12-4809]